MKQFTFAIFLFSFVISSSQAQRGWRLFDQFGRVSILHESRDGTLWAETDSGLWRYDHSGWQSVAEITGEVYVIHQSRDGTLWVISLGRLI